MTVTSTYELIVFFTLTSSFTSFTEIINWETGKQEFLIKTYKNQSQKQNKIQKFVKKTNLMDLRKILCLENESKKV